MGHDAERAQLQVAHGAGGERHRLRLQRQAAPVQRTRQRHPGGLQHLRGVQVFRPVPEDAVQGQVRGGDFLQPAGAGRDAGGDRRQHRDGQAVHLQHLHRAAEGRRRQAGHDQDRDLRGAGQGAVHQGAGEHEAAGRGGQAAHRLRRAALHLPLHRQVHAGPRPVPGHLPHQPARRRGQGLRLHRGLQGPVQEGGERHRGLHLRAGSQRRRGRSRGAAAGSLEEGQGAPRQRASKRSPCCASRSSRPRASWSTSTTSAATPRSRPT